MQSERGGIMAKKTAAKASKTILADCNPEVSFWVCNGTVLRNIYELASNLEKMPEDAFSYHVNNEKNDFANWIRDILGDKELADMLSKTRDQKKYLETIRKRIKSVESAQA
jgi:hypothetical protein